MFMQRRIRWLRRFTCGEYQFWRNVLLLYMITFLFALPIVCHSLRNTPLDMIFNRNETQEKHRMIEDNTARYNRSLEILKKMKESYQRGNSRYLRNLFQKEMSSSQSAARQFEKNNWQVADTNLRETKVGIAINIITVSRNRHSIEDYEPNYLTQTVAGFLDLLNKTESEQPSYKVDFRLSICNVDPEPETYTEVNSLPDWIPVYNRFSTKDRAHLQRHLSYDNLLNKEKEDYVYCLDKALEQNLSHVLLVEDDAVPLDDLFPVLDTVILNPKSFGTEYDNYLERVTYFKLYHPERLIGYVSIEAERLPELASLGLIITAIMVQLYTKYATRNTTSLKLIWFTFFAYSTLVIFTIGRPNIIEFRRLSKYLYQMTPAPSCCTPAILFPREGGRTVSEYLKTVECHDKFGKDTALDKMKKIKNLVTKLVQPNLFKHIGQFSSLRKNLINPFIV